jgi:hypothetical protein
MVFSCIFKIFIIEFVSFLAFKTDIFSHYFLIELQNVIQGHTDTPNYQYHVPVIFKNFAVSSNEMQGNRNMVLF